MVVAGNPESEFRLADSSWWQDIKSCQAVLKELPLVLRPEIAPEIGGLCLNVLTKRKNPR
jgi:hypothetical protein